MKRSFLGQYTFNLALSLDQFINVILLGDVDDSISGRCGRAMASGKPKWFVKPLAKFVDYAFLKLFKQVDHCKDSIEPEELMTYELYKWHSD